MKNQQNEKKNVDNKPIDINKETHVISNISKTSSNSIEIISDKCVSLAHGELELEIKD